MRGGGFSCFPCSPLKVPYLWASLGSSLVFYKLLLLIIYIYIYIYIYIFDRRWVYGFLPGRMAQVVGGIRNIFRKSLGQFGEA